MILVESTLDLENDSLVLETHNVSILFATDCVIMGAPCPNDSQYLITEAEGQYK